MITEAIQSVLDKLQEKEKLAIANRQQLKLLESKQKTSDAQVLSILKLATQVKEQQTKFKKVERIIDDQIMKQSADQQENTTNFNNFKSLLTQRVKEA